MKYATHHHTPMPPLALLWLALLLLFTGPSAQAQMQSGDTIRVKMFSTEGSMQMPNWCYSGPFIYGYTNGVGARMKCTFDLSQFALQWGFMDDGSTIVGTNLWAVSDESNTGASYTLGSATWNYLNGSGEVQSWFSSYYTGEDIYPIANIMGKGNLPAYGLSNVASKIDLVLVGPTGSSNEVLVCLGVSATDADTGMAIPESDITLAGKHPTNGVVWTKFTDNTTNDVTPAIIGHDNYTYNVAKAAAVRLGIKLGGTDITGQTLSTFPNSTNKIFVGSGISLSVGLDSSDVTITKYNWTLPGDKAIGFVDTLTNGHVDPFPASGNTNAQPPGFAWYKAGTNVVQCEVTINGTAVNAFGTLIVSNPDVQVTTVMGDVGMDTNFWDANYNKVNTPYLHLGTHNPTAGPLGIVFQRTLLGEISLGKCKWIQTANETLDIDVGTRWFNLAGDGLDKSEDETEGDNGSTNDSPNRPALERDQTIIRSMAAKMYLMWTAPGGSFPVPLWKTEWKWGGHAWLDEGDWWLSSSNKEVVSEGLSTSYPEWNAKLELLPVVP